MSAAAPRARERRCLVTGESPPEAELIRFVLSPDGVVVPDVASKLPGRGAWVRAGRAFVEAAAKRNVFARAFKAPAQCPPDLADRVESALARRCLDLLGLGRKAGALALGYDQVEAAIRANKAFGLIEASDGAEEGRARLMRLSIGLWGERPHISGCFSAAEMGMALGRDRVVHACWLQERMARLWTVEIGRLSGFRAITPSSWSVEQMDGSDAADRASRP